MKNYYDILEVNKRASIEVIEKAYRVLVKKYHPDLYSGQKKEYAEKKIKEINEAYNVLSDEFLKEQYDAELEREEMDRYSKLYKENQRLKQNANQNQDNNSKKSEADELNEKMKKHKVGSLSGIIELCKELYHNKPKREEVKEITKKDIFAVILTIIVVILIGIALWFIPFTNGWMRELLFENPLFSWIGNIFGN